ncbi:hypothetical protein BV898_04380 [Hypsibius exemplaris]|uniref:Anaphase-promoting complex subunit 5 n=1 Tax=Hypsibius exemplaris TaxID=2072580 RepID=A0A1W0X2W3_HYPEX|nr:hypothetical protein BV898_04380 [Hypsibius exemplaris]
MAHIDSILKGRPAEILSPYKLIVAVLIREYIRLRRELCPDLFSPKMTSLAKEKERDECRNYVTRNSIDLDNFALSAKEAFDTLRLLQHLARSPERSFSCLIYIIRRVLNKAHFLLFQRVIELFKKDDQDEIARYVDCNLGQVMHAAKMENATGSLFVQNVKVTFDEMTFTTCERFNDAVLEYINAGFMQMGEVYGKSPLSPDKESGSNGASVGVTESQTGYVLCREADLIETNPQAAGDLSFADEQVARVLDLKPSVENVAFVQYLDDIRRKNYQGALDALHRYSVLKGIPDERPWRNGDQSPALQPGGASLHICIMHFTAGHSALALESLKECIFLAQEKGATELLSTCMYWLAALELNNNQYEKLYRGARGGEFVRYPDVLRQFAAAIARFDALSGASMLKAFHDLNYSEAINDAACGCAALIQQYTTRATMWKLYGFEDLAVVYAQASVQLLAGAQPNGFPVANDAVALSLGLLLEQAVRKNDQPALEVLFDYSHETFPIDSSKEWHAWGLAELAWKYQKNFHQQDYGACEVIVDQLSVINPAEASLRRAELLYAKDLMPRKALILLSEMYDAGRNISAHIDDISKFSITLKLRILRLKGEIYLKTGCELEALETAKEALGLSVDHPNSLLKAKVQLQLAYIWYHLKELSQSRNCMALSFPVLCGCGCPLDEAKAWFLKGKLITPKNSLEEIRCYEHALELFSRCSSVADMLECLRLLAVLYDTMGQTASRDHVCGLFLTLHDKFPHIAVEKSL